jgi:RES domain-containing protein
MLIYRLHRSVRAAGDYTGALLAGGRWNPPGTAMLYATQHLSLACLEVFVHLDKAQLPPEYVWSKAELADDLAVLEIENVRHVSGCQTTGRKWTETAGELAVLVRSVVIPEEFNILLNPNHNHYDELVWSSPQAFRFDPRLFTFEPLQTG